MDLKKELGEKIKRFRKIRGLTQEQLAEMIDISARNLSNIEQGISSINSLNVLTKVFCQKKWAGLKLKNF